MPVGKRSDVEFSSTCVEPSVDAHRNTTLALYSRCSIVFASMMRTPVARFDFGSYVTLCTMLSVAIFRRPVARAAGSVELWVEK